MKLLPGWDKFSNEVALPFLNLSLLLVLVPIYWTCLASEISSPISSQLCLHCISVLWAFFLVGYMCCCGGGFFLFGFWWVFLVCVVFVLWGLFHFVLLFWVFPFFFWSVLGFFGFVLFSHFRYVASSIRFRVSTLCCPGLNKVETCQTDLPLHTDGARQGAPQTCLLNYSGFRLWFLPRYTWLPQGVRVDFCLCSDPGSFHYARSF